MSGGLTAGQAAFLVRDAVVWLTIVSRANLASSSIVTLISSIERASAGIISCRGFPSLCCRRSGLDSRGAALTDTGLEAPARATPSLFLIRSDEVRFRVRNYGPDGRLVRRFQVVRVGSSAKRAVAAFLGGHPLQTNSL